MRIRKGDIVKVLSGKNRGKTGRVLKVDVAKLRVLVEGVNLIKRHSRPTQKNPKGGVVEKESPLHISKVQLMDTRNNTPTRVGCRIMQNDRGQITGKVRISKKSGEMI
jgi:large subunit ribosomal protein L24